MKRLFAAALVVVGLLTALIAPAQAVTVTPGGVYRMDYDYSSNGAGPYDTLYWGATYSSSPPGANFVISAYDSNDNFLGSQNVLLPVAVSGGVSSGFSVNTNDPIGHLLFESINLTTNLSLAYVGLNNGPCPCPGDGYVSGPFYEAPAPVPIPAALPLLMSALGVFGFFGRRR